MTHILLVALLVTVLMEHGVSGARCRFDSTSASRGTCIFPCRCTKGCDQVTGNVAFDKETSQSTAIWGDKYLASKAVDGAIDPLGYQHCAVPNAMPGSSTWWKVDFGGNYQISRVIIYNSDTVLAEAPQCPAIEKNARVRCGAAGIKGLACQDQGCCWDGQARGNDIACYRRQCKAGYFGWRCRFQCHKCSTCDGVTGKCPVTCQDDRWGVGCMLKCEDGHFGVFCDGTCHCRTGSCNKTTGHCPSGCAPGWSGDNCQTDRLHIKDERRLSTFTLSVGNNSDMNGHSQCASHNGAVAAGATVNESCSATGRYLSFRRNGAGDNHWTTLCEVVVIGHRYVSCQHCPSTSTCNDVIGCDACAPGKQQPDCVNDCDDGSYGINCNDSCGHCKDQSKCSVTMGSCPNGCETWYISDVCNTYIAIPGFQPCVKPDVDDVTSSSATVSWPKASNIAAGLESNYHYVLWLQADGESEKDIKRVEQGAGEQLMEAQITGLRINTRYSLRVQPYRQHNGERDGGTATGVVRFKTRCPALSAVLESVTATTPGPTTFASIVVIWKVITESECDAAAAVRVEYKQQKTDSWKSVEADRVSQTYKIIRDNLSYEQYEVRLVFTNNENIAYTSASKYVDLRTCTGSASPFQTTATPTTHTARSAAALAAPNDAAFGTGAWIGIAVGSLVLGMVIMASILLGIPRMRQSFGKTNNEQQGTEMSPRNRDEAVGGALGYVIPPTTVSRKHEGVVEDASGYYTLASESRQRVDHNVYDVIRT
ncbi:hypothetical protein LSAT2_009049 [Lamellibrachia satsuma]|nr:hypothetical protein LSAT2_009049 [Lamellibrachia satsuma]